jgi:alcohol dehydrogenase
MPDPTPPADGVVIAVQANGICRSDWHGWQGHDPDIQTLPHIPGHELAGEVVAIGKEVRRWKVGDRVTVPFVLGCGRCPDCARGDHQVCANQHQPGFTGWGSFAEYVALPYADVNLVAIPDALDAASVASLGCRFATAFRAVVVQGRVKPGEWVVVHGCGGVGLSAIMIAVAMGGQVIAVDIKPEALALAKSLGAVHTIHAREATNVAEAVHDLTRGGAHVALDALGSAVTVRSAILSLRRRGRHVQVGLLVGPDANPSLPMGRVIGWELEIYGSHGLQAHVYPEVLRLIENGTLDPSRLVTKRVALDEVPDILQSMTTYNPTGIQVMDRF